MLHRTTSLQIVQFIQTIEICMIHLHNIKLALKGQNWHWAKLVQKSQVIETVLWWCHQSSHTYRQTVRSLQPCGNVTTTHAVSLPARADETQLKTLLMLPVLQFGVWKGYEKISSPVRPCQQIDNLQICWLNHCWQCITDKAPAPWQWVE